MREGRSRTLITYSRGSRTSDFLETRDVILLALQLCPSF
jgi:hypothetical protein